MLWSGDCLVRGTACAVVWGLSCEACMEHIVNTVYGAYC